MEATTPFLKDEDELASEYPQNSGINSPNAPTEIITNEDASSYKQISISDEDQDEDDGKEIVVKSCIDETVDLIRITIPMFLSGLSWVAMKTTDTALLGHVSTHALEAASLSDLWTNSTGVFIQGRILGVLVGQAVGAKNNKLAGIWLQLSIVICGLLAIPVIVLWAGTEIVMRWFGEHDLASDAGYYALILMLCIPARVAFSQLSQYFVAQRILSPSTITAVLTMSANLIAGLILVKGVPIPGFDGYGFKACPIVTTACEWLQLLFMYFVFVKVQKLHLPCWPTRGWQRSQWTKKRIRAYLKLYAPAALSISEAFWRFALIGVMAASLSKTDLAVFNSSYRILWMCLTLVGSLGRAVGVKLGLALGASKTAPAKQTAKVGIIMVTVLLGALGLTVCFNNRHLGRIFSTDEKVLDLYHDIRIPMAFLTFTMNYTVFLEAYLMAMGRTKAVLYSGLVGSWIGQVPCVFLLIHYWKKSLVGLYSGMVLGYGLQLVIYLVLVFNTDWEYWAEKAVERSEAKRQLKNKAGSSDSEEEEIIE